MATCSKCSTHNPDDARFCVSCGTAITSIPTAAPAQPYSPQPQMAKPIAPSINTHFNAEEAPSATSQGTSIGFLDAIKICLTKYFDKNGRAARPEYWWFYLFYILVSIISAVIGFPLQLAIMIPAINATTRRLHDTGRSGWWQLITLTVIGVIPLLIWLASEGNKEDNKYGPPA